MRLSKLVGRTLKESPRDAEIPSHKFLLRAGYVRQYSAGIYGLLPLGHRAVTKIGKIVREEMDRVGGQEILMPCLMTKELWDETGRYSSIGRELFRLSDRNDKNFVLGFTHEEPVVYLARTEVTSYKQLPVMLYQVQLKFRDEPRPRGGLIRVREFVMKDGYSFHESEEDLAKYYDQVHEAYNRVFRRAGCKNFVSVKSDNGVFGGSYSHEFMTLTPNGEDTLLICPKCAYRANKEVAVSPFVPQRVGTHAGAPQGDFLRGAKPLEKVSTPGIKTIEDLCGFLKLEAEQTCKAVMFQTTKGELVIAFVRGDKDVVEQKVKVAIRSDLARATDATLAAAGAVAGSTGPVGIDLSKARIVFDQSIQRGMNFAVGANADGMHLVNFNLERDFLSGLSGWQKEKIAVAQIAEVKAGDPCPQCGSGLGEHRGIEIGNIFHLGTRYSAAMGMTYLDAAGKAQTPVMGCYGIGVSRLLPSVIEEHHDDRGMILPITIAPHEVHMCVLNRKEAAVQAKSEALYQELSAAGVDVLLDDRDEKPGSQFADADLMGIPLRITVAPRGLEKGVVEFKYRDGRAEMENIALADLVQVVQTRVRLEYERYPAAKL